MSAASFAALPTRAGTSAGRTRDGSLAKTFARLRAAGVDRATIAGTLAAAHVSPVLTAHPTEVRDRQDDEAGIGSDRMRAH